MGLSPLGLNAASAGISSLLGMASAGINYRYQKKLMNYQNELNIQNWMMQNEYNTPLNQRNRMIEAGINPVLAGNEGQMAEGISPVAQSASPGLDLQRALEQGTNAMNAETQKTVGMAEADYKKALTLTENQLREGKLTFMGLTIEFQGIKNKAERQAMAVQIQELELKTKQVTEQLQQKWAKLSLEQQETAIKQLQSELDAKLKSQQLDQQQVRFIYEILETKAGISLLHARTNAANASANLANAQAEGQSIQNNLDSQFGSTERAAGIEESRTRTFLNRANTSNVYSDTKNKKMEYIHLESKYDPQTVLDMMCGVLYHFEDSL